MWVLLWHRPAEVILSAVVSITIKVIFFTRLLMVHTVRPQFPTPLTPPWFALVLKHVWVSLWQVAAPDSFYSENRLFKEILSVKIELSHLISLCGVVRQILLHYWLFAADHLGEKNMVPAHLDHYRKIRWERYGVILYESHVAYGHPHPLKKEYKYNWPCQMNANKSSDAA